MRECFGSRQKWIAWMIGIKKVPNTIGRLLHKLAYIVPGGYSLRPWLHKIWGSRIGKGVWISQLVYIDELYPEAVTIGENSTIGL